MKIHGLPRGLDPIRQILWLFVIWMVLGSLLWIWWDERTMPDIRGDWASAGCEEVYSQDGVSYLKRTMRIDEATWHLIVDFHEDKDCISALFSLEIDGPYDLGPSSMEVRDATTARFELRRLILTPRSGKMATVFEQADCASGRWQVGEGQETTEFGCLGMVPTVSTCQVEYDIVKIEDDRLYFGDRSRGICRPGRYPSGFAPTPLHRTSSNAHEALYRVLRKNS